MSTVIEGMGSCIYFRKHMGDANRTVSYSWRGGKKDHNYREKLNMTDNSGSNYQPTDPIEIEMHPKRRISHRERRREGVEGVQAQCGCVERRVVSCVVGNIDKQRNNPARSHIFDKQIEVEASLDMLTVEYLAAVYQISQVEDS